MRAPIGRDGWSGTERCEGKGAPATLERRGPPGLGSGKRHPPAASAGPRRELPGFSPPGKNRELRLGYPLRSSSVKLSSSSCTVTRRPAASSEFDQLVGMVVSAFTSALDRIEVFVRVFCGGDRGWLPDRAEHQVGGDRRRVGVPDVGGDQLGGEASLGENGREREYGGAGRPAVGAVRLTGPIVDRDRQRDVAAHVRHGSGDRSAGGGSYVWALTPSSSASRARSFRKSRFLVSTCHRREAKSNMDPPALQAP